MRIERLGDVTSSVGSRADDRRSDYLRIESPWAAGGNDNSCGGRITSRLIRADSNKLTLKEMGRRAEIVVRWADMHKWLTHK